MIASMGQLSVMLEASAPKPGNVNRLYRFSDTGYRHFLASASLMNRGLYNAAARGMKLAERRIAASEVGIGNLILQCSTDVLTGINRSNTILGTMLLHTPLAVAFGATLSKGTDLDADKVLSTIEMILNHTSNVDTLNLYNAFHLVHSNGSVSRVDTDWTELHRRYDILNPEVLENIKEDEVTLMDLFKASSSVDRICKEWSLNFSTVVKEIAPYLDSQVTGLDDLEEGVVKTFIWQLSREPDGHIVKKAGNERAEMIRGLAETIMEGASNGSDPMNLMRTLDEELRREGNLLNPGTTADLVSAALFYELVSLSTKATTR
jgi:triphosphoribosyl-dephospho-CoA synthase